MIKPDIQVTVEEKQGKMKENHDEHGPNLSLRGMSEHASRTVGVRMSSMYPDP